MTMSNTSTSWIAGLLVAAGLAAGGWAVGEGLKGLRVADRYVTVKGLAEKEVPADLVIWPITYVQPGNDLGEMYARIERNNTVIQDFLKANGLAEAQVSSAPPKLSDYEADGGYDNGRRPFRYRAEVVLTVRSQKVDAVKAAMQRAGELVKQGIVFANYAAQPEFVFTGLNQIKPALIAEATQNARTAAEQFAADSGSHVGGIRSANQGLISINDRDAGSPDIKIVRVVTTVEYGLK
jgi:hypothetical protein